MKNTPLYKIFFSALAITLIIALASLAVIGQSEKAFNPPPEKINNLSLSGNYKINDGEQVLLSSENNEFPNTGQNKIIFSGHFDQEIPQGSSVIMRIANLKVNFLINNEPVFSFGQTGSMPANVRSAGNGWKSFDSPGITPQDNIEIHLESIYNHNESNSFAMFFERLYGGSEAALITKNITDNLFNSFSSLFIICMGLVCIAVYIMILLMKKNTPVLLIFAMLCICSGIWFFIDFNVYSYYVPFPIFSNSLDMLMLMFTVVFLTLYFYTFLKNKCRNALIYVIFMWLALIIVSSIAQLMGIADYYDFKNTVAVCTIITVAVKSAVFIVEWLKHSGKDILELSIAAAIICVGLLIDVTFSAIKTGYGVIWFKVLFLISLIFQLVIIGKYLRDMFASETNLKVLEIQHTELSRILEYQQIITESAKGLYDIVYELDITNDRAGDKSARNYYEDIGLSADTPFSEALEFIATNHISAEHSQGYIDMFHPKHVLKVFAQGTDYLRYDFLFSRDCKNYYWIRTHARIFYWKAEDSVRMIIYRQNIDSEKRHEAELSEQTKRDPFTELYNKTATISLINAELSSPTPIHYAFFIIDIDNFKNVNDNHGHDVGDKVIVGFANALKEQFRDDDIISRIGGDEFSIFLKVPDMKWLKQKANDLITNMNFECSNCHITPSIGIAVSPQSGIDFETLYKNADKALYHSKNNGKNSYTFYDDIKK